MRQQWCSVIVVVTGCGRLAFDGLQVSGDSLASDLSADGATAPLTCGPWGSPQPVAELNTPNSEQSASISPDGLAIVFISGNVPRIATRADRTSPFSAPIDVPALGTSMTGWDYALLPGGTELIFYVQPMIDCPRSVVATTTRYVFDGPIRDLTVGCLPPMRGITVLPDGLTAYSIAGTNPLLQVARRSAADQPFTTATTIGELTAINAGYPAIRSDDRELLFEAPSALGDLDLWSSTRASPSDPWSPPTTLPFSTAASDEDVSLTADGSELYFDSVVVGGGNDVFVVKRTCN